MTNPITKQHTINLGGRTHALHYEHCDFAEAEEKLGKPLLGPGAQDFWAAKTPSANVGVLLFIGLQREMPDLTLRDARRLITFRNAVEIEQTVTKAVREAIVGDAEPEESEAHDESPLASATGGTSDGSSVA